MMLVVLARSSRSSRRFVPLLLLVMDTMVVAVVVMVVLFPKGRRKRRHDLRPEAAQRRTSCLEAVAACWSCGCAAGAAVEECAAVASRPPAQGPPPAVGRYGSLRRR